jgi:hypothetical protein
MKNKVWLVFYMAHSGDQMSIQKTTSSYAWMTKANICLHNCILCMVASFSGATLVLIVLYICMKILSAHLLHQ